MKRIILFFAALVLLSNAVLAVDYSQNGKAIGYYMDAMKAYKAGKSNLTKEELRSAAGNSPNLKLSDYLAGLESKYDSTGQMDNAFGKKIVYSFGFSSNLDPNDPFNPNPAPRSRQQKIRDFIEMVKEMHNKRGS